MRRILFVVGTLFAFSLLGVPNAHAQTPNFVEHIADYDVVMDVATDGTLAVTETIVYNFGPVPKHGIFRDLVKKEVYGNDGAYDRVYKLDVTSVTTDGKKAQTKE